MFSFRNCHILLGFPDSSVGKESACSAGDPGLIPGSEDPLKKGDATHSSVLGLFCGSAGKESACEAGDLGLIPGLGRSPGEEKGYPLQYSGLENCMNCIVHGVTKSQIGLRDFHIHTKTNNREVLPDPLPYKLTGLVKRFLLRRKNMYSSKIHCCYIIISTELKAKATL